MKKIRIAAVLFILMLIGSGLYVNVLKKSVKKMTDAVSDAYYCVDSSYTTVLKQLDLVDDELDKKGIVFCAFIDQKLISDVENEIRIAKELYNQKNKNELKLSLIRLNKKIDSLKDTEEFNLKKILRTKYKYVFYAV